MGSGKAKKPSKLSHTNPKNKGRPLGPKTRKTKADSHTRSKKKKEKKQRLSNGGGNGNPIDEKASNQSSQNDNGLSEGAEVQPASASAQLSFFLDKFQSANGVQLSSLELESFNGTFYFVNLSVYIFSCILLIMRSVWLVRKCWGI